MRFYALSVGTAVAAVTIMTAVVVSAGAAGGIVDLVLRGHTLQLNECIPTGQVNATLIVNLNALNHNGVANINDILYTLGAFYIQAADVNQTLFARCNLYECAEAHQAGYYTVVEGAHFRVVAISFTTSTAPLHLSISIPLMNTRPSSSMLIFTS